jgi:hypothetical protein
LKEVPVPNKFVKAEKYVAMALAMLERDSVLPNVVTRFDGGAFVGAEGDVVNFRLPGITTARDYEWRTRTAPIVLDTITRTTVPIKLDTHTYSAVPITDEELTLDVEDFAADVVEPQLVAVRDRLESKVPAALAAAPFKTTDLDAAEADDPYLFALHARAVLNAQGTPKGNRTLLVGTNVEEWMLSSDRITKQDPAAATTAYREAVLGRTAGFDIASSSLIPANAVYAMHASALVLANVAPAVPQGVAYGARRNYRGYGLRVIRDYDSNFARDRSMVSTFTGISSVNDEYQRNSDGSVVIGSDGLPVITTKNVRGARGTFTPAA